MLTIVADNRTNQSHALTCYGIDFDADGNITALYTSDSDDGTFQLSRHALRNTTYNGKEAYWLWDEGAYAPQWYLYLVDYIDTPDELKKMLADYETNPLTWTGTLDSWKNVETSDYTRADQLPTDATGWKVFAGEGEAHAGYYSSYYDKNRAVLFDDVAQSGDVSLGENAVLEIGGEEKSYTLERNAKNFGNGKIFDAILNAEKICGAT